MPWVFMNGNGTQRRRRRRSNRAYQNGNGYGNNYQAFPNYQRARTKRDDYDANRPGYDNAGDYNNTDFDGFYDRNGDRVRLVIQAPNDMLPPRRAASEDRQDQNLYRSRARY